MYLEYSLLCKAMGRSCSEWSLVATCNKQEFNHSEHVRHVMKCPSILHVHTTDDLHSASPVMVTTDVKKQSISLSISLPPSQWCRWLNHWQCITFLSIFVHVAKSARAQHTGWHTNKTQTTTAADHEQLLLWTCDNYYSLPARNNVMYKNLKIQI